MTPGRAAALLRATLASMETWLRELEEIEKSCPGRAIHLLGVIRQAKMGLESVLRQERDDDVQET